MMHSARSRSLLIAFAIIFLFAGVVHAQSERSYYYGKIVVDISVREDASIYVEEGQTFNFDGVYHQGYREISGGGIGAITDVQVRDADTGEVYEYSLTRIDKESPSSWGKYTVYQNDGATVIDWYYDLEKHSEPYQHTWILSYVVHGAVTFYDDHDELYWDLFTDYDVPVVVVEAFVHLPQDITRPQSTFYRQAAEGHVSDRPDERTYRFQTWNVIPGEDASLAVGWQKGIISKSAFWKDFLLVHWGAFLAAIIFFVSLIIVIVDARMDAHRDRARGTIIPHYEPPRNLRPAMAQLITKGSVNNKGWAATVVDLAVRSHIKIEEDLPKYPVLAKAMRFGIVGAAIVFGIGLLGVFALPYYITGEIEWEFLLTIGVFVMAIFLTLGFRVYHYALRQKDYVLRKTAGSESSLEEYEKDFLRILFTEGDTFSTRAIRKSTTKAREMHLMLQAVQKSLQTETELDTDAYVKVPSMGPIAIALSIFILVPVIFVSFFADYLFTSDYFWLAVSIVVSGLMLTMGLKYAKRLNKTGYQLREDWLGFKLYLEKAEQYRLQDLTPETFEKYLPYAIMFGIEKKWAGAFKGFSMEPPNWYVGSEIGRAHV